MGIIIKKHKRVRKNKVTVVRQHARKATVGTKSAKTGLVKQADGSWKAIQGKTNLVEKTSKNLVNAHKELTHVMSWSDKQWKTELAAVNKGKTSNLLTKKAWIDGIKADIKKHSKGGKISVDRAKEQLSIHTKNKALRSKATNKSLKSRNTKDDNYTNLQELRN